MSRSARCSSPTPMRPRESGPSSPQRARKRALLLPTTPWAWQKARKRRQKSLLDGSREVGMLARPMSPTKTQAHAPARSLDQRMDALNKANDVRVKRAQLKKDLKDGKTR